MSQAVTEIAGAAANPAVFISWQQHRRTAEICRWFGLEAVTLVTRSRGALRYLKLIGRTTAWLWRRRPRVVVVQNPSVVLTTLCALLRRPLGFRLLMDAHNEAVTPFLVPHPAMRWLTHKLHAHVDAVVVTNKYLAQTIEENGGTPIVLADPIPEAPATSGNDSAGGPRNVVFVSTFAADEPLEEVLAAARQLGDGYRFKVTGNDRHLAAEVRKAAPVNVAFTGFLSEHDYWQALASADVVVDLTMIDNCLVCGAYESVAVGVPLVLSANSASRELFGDVARFTDNSAASIAREVEAACAGRAALVASIPATRRALNLRWESDAAHFRRAIAVA